MVEAEEEFLPKKDEAEVLKCSWYRGKQVIQVDRGLINKKFNVITIRNLVIMHMNAGRNNMTKEGKSQISRPTSTL